jgi:hypothetical protein
MITVSCVLSMFASIVVLIVYMAYSVGSSICTFQTDFALHVLRECFQLVFLIGVVAAFAYHSFQGSTHPSKSSSQREDRNGAMSEKGVDDIILDLNTGTKKVSVEHLESV